MFDALLNTVANVGHGKFRTWVTTGALLAGMAGIPSAAFARNHGFFLELSVPFPEVRVVVPEMRIQCAPPQCPPPQCAPVQVTTVRQVWVAPVYQAVTEKVWVADVTTTQIQRVEVPAQVGYRDVIQTDYYGRSHLYREQVIISPAHCENRAVTVVVTPAHVELRSRQQLVCDGHWETQAVPVTVIQTIPGN